MRLFDELIAVGERMLTAPRRQVKHHDAVVVTLTPEGVLQDVQPAPQGLVLTTFLISRSMDVAPTPGPVETAVYALGYSPEKPEKGPPRHAAYRALAEKVASAAGPGQAIVEFLPRASDVHARLAELGATGLTWVYFRVEGAPDEWWLDPRIDRLALDIVQAKATSPEVVHCPFCGDYAPAARLFGEADKSALVSFNNPSSEAYGASQGLVAPTCQTCAARMTAGLDHLLKDSSATQSPSGASGVRYVWWTEGGVGLWPKLQTALVYAAGVQPPPVSEVDLPTRSHLLVLERNRKRWAACRFATVSAQDLHDRWARWRATVGAPWLFQVVSAVLGRERSRSDQDTAWDRVYTEVVLHLIAGEPLSGVFERQVQSILSRVERDRLYLELALGTGRGAVAVKILRGLLQYLGPEEVKVEMEQQSSPYYWLGRAYRRAAGAQRRKVDPQRGLDGDVGRMSGRSPEVVVKAVLRHAVWRTARGREASDRKTTEYLTRMQAIVHQLVGVQPEASARWFATRPKSQDRLAFLAGYHDEAQPIERTNETQPSETTKEAP